MNKNITSELNYTSISCFTNYTYEIKQLINPYDHMNHLLLNIPNSSKTLPILR